MRRNNVPRHGRGPIATGTLDSAAAGDGVAPCPRERIRTASGCTSLAAAGREIRAIVELSVQDNDPRAALVRVDLGNRSIARVAGGESMDGGGMTGSCGSWSP